MIDKFLKFLYGSLFFLTPLIFAPLTSELFEFNKIIFIYVITILVGFFWLLKMILAKKTYFKRTPLDTPILLFLISQIASSIFSIDRHVSFFGYYGRFNGGLLSTISYIILYYGFVSNSFNIISFLKTSLWSSVLVMIYGLPGKLGHDLTCFLVSAGRTFDNSCWSRETNVFDPANRSFSTLGQPNWLGAYLAINFFIGIYFYVFYLRHSGKRPSNYEGAHPESQRGFWTSQNDWKAFVYLFVNFSFILFTRSRSALAAVSIGLILFISYYLLFIKLNTKKLIITLLFITVIPAILFKTGIDKFDKFLKFPTSIFQSPNPLPASKNQPPSSNNSGVTESLDIRKIVWKGAVDLGLKYPLFGTGVETFAYSYYFVRPVEHNLTSEWDFIYNKAHNEFLNYLATTGFIGLGAYLLLIISFFYYLIKELRIKNYELKKENKKSVIRNPQSSNQIILFMCLLISYLTILITNFFGFSTTTINLFFFLIPAFTMSLRGGDEVDDEAISSKRHTNYQYFSIFIISGFTIYLLLATFSYWFADTQYALGLNYLKPGISDFQKAAGYFESALKVRVEPVYEDKFSSSLSYLAAIAFYQKQTDLANQIIKMSDYYNKKSLNASSKNIFYWKTRAKNQYLFYQVTLDNKDLEEGINVLLTGQKLAPTDPKIPYSLAVYYQLIYNQAKEQSIKENAKQASLLEIDKAIALKKDFQDALILKDDLLKKYGLL
ncbi:MAG: hypothetical protein US40_C0006G0004 [Candidatus Roizmanbacteria bacterium GW2011_GWC2_37_13]|uniref:O-antigen ligase-related domain-containing protein n=1 Tax=Candidatus Roizmanbacteria bacterium GW2011_GWC2_37_13 TaxID=1618486 RepID=A0A0G0G6L8_9BACT|nr:MAG: hypothetical protein US38_C0010G0007 [Candidatus Roizmanbacteria bacterium GW2011_GWC1_37_12]KKQ25687.1 MAG: hypothetical protein US40_C0006G0004 [Candidatus Roizmanbacteria bacterium GW2011_GWC2_37_13]